MRDLRLKDWIQTKGSKTWQSGPDFEPLDFLHSFANHLFSRLLYLRLSRVLSRDWWATWLQCCCFWYRNKVACPELWQSLILLWIFPKLHRILTCKVNLESWSEHIRCRYQDYGVPQLPLYLGWGVMPNSQKLVEADFGLFCFANHCQKQG